MHQEIAVRKDNTFFLITLKLSCVGHVALDEAAVIDSKLLVQLFLTLLSYLSI